MFCMNCGAQLSDTAKFCGSCGTKVELPDLGVPGRRSCVSSGEQLSAC